MTGLRRLGSGLGVALVAVLVWRLGTGPFVDGVRAVDAPAIAGAVALGLVTTASCAWRWAVIARGLGAPVGFRSALAAYYRSVFLNATLPGGILGDLHRGLRHGRDTRDVARGLRAVWWERASGQCVQVAVTLVALLVLPSPLTRVVPVIALVLLLVVIVAAIAGRRPVPSARSRLAALRRAIAADLHAGLGASDAWPAVLLASLLAIGGSVATFVLAAHAAGVAEPPSRLVPLALLVLLAMVLPGIAGFGPREGAAAWAFAGAGLGATAGVASAVAFAVLVLASSLPGAAILVRDAVTARRPRVAIAAANEAVGD